jgi:hypothetical protein
MTTPLERLIRLAPPAVRPGPVDWPDAVRRLGHELPADYKELVDTYGPGEFDAHVRLRTPEGAGSGRGLIATPSPRPPSSPASWPGRSTPRSSPPNSPRPTIRSIPTLGDRLERATVPAAGRLGRCRSASGIRHPPMTRNRNRSWTRRPHWPL